MVPFRLDALEAALSQLAKGLTRARANPGDEELRDAVIQRFEYTYELAWTTLKRFVQTHLPAGSRVDEMSLAELIRTGSEAGLLRSDWPAWKRFRELRGATSHTYDRAKAEEVFAAIPEFETEARHLLERLRERTTAR
ncbi:MAG TPA: nucleotidyltransferase substrate binding protein [Myxococcales bacterium]|nr:nucleotidyltransferase substrate binding protein [Myxococcales bacterium]